MLYNAISCDNTVWYMLIELYTRILTCCCCWGVEWRTKPGSQVRRERLRLPATTRGRCRSSHWRGCRGGHTARWSCEC